MSAAESPSAATARTARPGRLPAATLRTKWLPGAVLRHLTHEMVAVMPCSRRFATTSSCVRCSHPAVAPSRRPAVTSASRQVTTRTNNAQPTSTKRGDPASATHSSDRDIRRSSWELPRDWRAEDWRAEDRRERGRLRVSSHSGEPLRASITPLPRLGCFRGHPAACPRSSCRVTTWLPPASAECDRITSNRN